MQEGLVISNISNLYIVESKKEIYECAPRGKLKKDDISPLVGDIVDIDILNEEDKKGIIENIHDRKIYLKRPKMSNITQIIFVVSLKMPNPDLLMLDKQLAYSEYLKIKPIIVLNKIDLASKDEIDNIKQIYENIGYKVILTNAKEKKGISEIKNVLNNNISAFTGNSGVGKSTLLNCLYDDKKTVEGEISNKNKRGKNTTTGVKLYKINENSYIADTPGFSTFDISEIESENLEKYFREFNEYIPNCEFVGCTHIKENNCGIKEAVLKQKISKDRYERFKKIYEELKDREARKW